MAAPRLVIGHNVTVPLFRWRQAVGLPSHLITADVCFTVATREAAQQFLVEVIGLRPEQATIISHTVRMAYQRDWSVDVHRLVKAGVIDREVPSLHVWSSMGEAPHVIRAVGPDEAVVVGKWTKRDDRHQRRLVRLR